MIYCKRTSFRIANKSYNKILQIHKKMKAKNVMKKIILYLQDSITINYIEYKHKNTGTSCTIICISGLQCFNSSTEY